MSILEEQEIVTEQVPPIIDTEHLEPILENPTPAHIPVLRQLGIALFLLVFVFSTTYVGTLIALVSPQEASPEIEVSAKLAESASATSYTNPFDDVTVTARSAFVWDVRTQRPLFTKNADESLPLASITKLMTALVAYELLDDSTKIDISVDAIRIDGDSGLSDGEIFSLRDLTDMVLMASSNDGAAALGEAAGKVVNAPADPDATFIRAMNVRAEELGLTNTRFKNVTGLDLSATEAGAYSSARDVAILLEYIISTYPTVTSLTTAQNTRIYNEAGEYHDIENTNEVVDRIDGLLASKTGYTELAGGNLTIAFEAGLNRPIIVVVLGSTFNDRFSDVLTLSERAREYVANE